MRVSRTLWLTILLALAILVPFALFGERIDAAVARWLPQAAHSRPLAAVVLGGLLAVDILVPVPSSLVSTACGSVLGFGAGLLTSWVGMMASGVAGYGLGRWASARALRWVGERDAAALARLEARMGTGFLLAMRPVPVLAEASALFAGISRLPFPRVLAALALGNAGVSAVYAAVGAWGRTEGSFLAAFGVALLLTGLALLAQRFGTRWSRRRGVAVLVALLALGVPVLPWWASRVIRRTAERRVSDELSDVPVRRCALVLGCSPRLADGRPNLYFRYRIEAAARLYQAGKASRLIVSGDNHRKGYDEPSEMKAALVAAGVPAEHIQPDYAGFRTLDSVVRVRAVFGQEAVIVVSQAFHNRRAVYLGQHRGVDVFGYNARDVGSVAGLRTRLRERLACLQAVLDVRLLGTGPRFLGPPVAVE